MDNKPLDRLEELFQSARALPPSERRAFLGASCGDDRALRDELESLLLADQEADAEHFLGDPPVGLAHLFDEMDDLNNDMYLGRRIGPYMALRRLGRGGMGDVYLAVREQPFKRHVALKIIRQELASRETFVRFAMEQQILASLSHPNIARLFDGGVTDEGLPYLAMEYVDGRSIVDYCDEHRLTLRERLRLFQTVCEAVHYAHKNLIIHRDLKPSNIFVSDDGTVKLLDFGIAKLLNPNLSPASLPVTHAGVQVMTPEYASPEQIRDEPLTTASDVYALGVILYKLLTGYPPYQLTGQSAREIAQTICDREPERPSIKVGQRQLASQVGTLHDNAAQKGAAPASSLAAIAAARNVTVEQLQRQLRGDLDNITMMALRKESDRRYASAEQLRQDVERYLTDQPVSARPSTARYRVGKFIRRHGVETAAAIGVVLALIMGAGVALWQATEAQAERDRAESALAQSKEVTQFLIGLFEAGDPTITQGDTITARELLARGVARAEQLHDQPVVQAQMLDAVGRVYINLAQYDQARPLLERALGLRRMHLGVSHPDVIQSLIHLGTLHLNRAEYAAARLIYREVLPLQQERLGSIHPDVAQSLNLLATALRHEGHFDAADSLFRRSLEVYRALPEEHPEEAAVMNNRAVLLRQRGKYAAAEALHREALAAQRRLLGPTHPYVATSLSNLAVTLYLQGDHAAAESVAREALSLREQLFGRKHPKVATSLNQLGRILQGTGDVGVAEALFRETLALRRELLGPEHPDVALAMTNLGTLLYERGELDEAEGLLRQALAVNRALLGPQHPDVASSASKLAAVRYARGHFIEAEGLYQEALSIYRAQYDASYEGVQAVYQGLASLYDGWNQPDSAAHYYGLVEGTRLAPTATGSAQ